jgi:CelD/BcsL family acetyltransferase involved in cellulose biosynthesis
VSRMEGGLSAKRLARLRSLERKLAREHGDVACVAAEGADAVEAWIDAFLVLEAAGWKGREGSALACAASSAGLFREVVTRAAAEGNIRCLTLTAGGQTLAMSSFLIRDGHGFGFKCAFDEGFASYAPGILLLRRIMAVVAEGPDLQFDSCSSPKEATINALWPERRAVVDVAVALRGPLAALRYRAAMRARRAWHGWKRRR